MHSNEYVAWILWLYFATLAIVLLLYEFSLLNLVTCLFKIHVLKDGIFVLCFSSIYYDCLIIFLRGRNFFFFFKKVLIKFIFIFCDFFFILFKSIVVIIFSWIIPCFYLIYVLILKIWGFFRILQYKFYLYFVLIF